MKSVESDQEFEELLRSPTLIVDCFATWCWPCKFIAGPLHELELKFSSATFVQVDVDKLKDVAARLEITAMPTIITFKHGKEVERVVGAEISKIEAMIKKHAQESFGGSGHTLGSASTPTPTPQPQQASASSKISIPTQLGPKPQGDCDIQLRLPDGSIAKTRFSKADTMSDVYAYVTEIMGGEEFRIMTNFPKRVYGPDDLSRTLEDEKLAPRGQLFVAKA
ncbi:hypothetical protein SmJEL517_g03263 [Synchytrium microbalum]|uniref:Thioredoxin domain-containing protein n=1 Tax=Synchytrium microbalum TaxID=1806994 RepID=A0A507C7G8_9FUNG|nr:uncharacterized protein SmJEL517_g03263 [Synchytrium microbalum]TPX34014.1 hypothetical protein SmJEL517_g03263 [Synchytrium microbalum]